MQTPRLALAAVVLATAACSTAPRTTADGIRAGTSPSLDASAGRRASEAIGEDGTIRNGARLSGSYEVAALHLPPAHIAYVTDDLTIRVRGDATIEGTLVAIRDVERRDAPDIRIVAGGRLDVTGVVHGAPGRDFAVEDVGVEGGRGTTVWLRGATAWNRGHIIGGQGGRSGGGAKGGTGSAALLVGDPVPAASELPDVRAAAIGGSGGEGGPGTELGGGAYRGGGDGGNGGVAGGFRTADAAAAALRESER